MLAALPVIPFETWVAFVPAGILLNLTPGSDVMFATASGVAGGPRTGAIAGLGVGLGSVWHIALAAVGVSAVLAASPGAMLVLRWGGAAYLLYLAISAWTTGPASSVQGIANPASALWRGFLTNALNPKVALFVLAFLPQFTNPALGPIWQQILMLGLVFFVTGTVITASYGALAGIAGQALSARMGAMNRAAAVVFAILALRMVWE
jgi:threonine/homoserine/homoserine lactone efflux protein